MAVYLGSNQVDLLGGDGIPSAYLIPSGTYSISQNGTYDIGSYKSASVDLPYYEAYYSLATSRVLYYTDSVIQSFCNSLNSIKDWLFAGKEFEPQGTSFIFENALTIGSNAFRSETRGGYTSYSSGYNFYFPNCSIVGSSAFKYVDKCTGVYGSSVTLLNQYCFAACRNLIEVNFPSCISIGGYAFNNCQSLISYSFPHCSYIGNSAFYRTRFTSANFPSCSYIGNNAFEYCEKLIIADFPRCEIIGSSAFYNCFSLTTISFPICSSIGGYAFQYCSSLNSVLISNCSYIGNDAFRGCKNLTSINFSKCTYISDNAFAYCHALTTISLISCSYFGDYAFRNCCNLLSVYLLGSSIPTLYDTDVFYSTPISNYTTSTGGVRGSIFVRASLYNDFITARYWSYYSSCIVSLTDEQIVALG